MVSLSTAPLWFAAFLNIFSRHHLKCRFIKYFELAATVCFKLAPSNYVQRGLESTLSGSLTTFLSKCCDDVPSEVAS